MLNSRTLFAAAVLAAPLLAVAQPGQNLSSGGEKSTSATSGQTAQPAGPAPKASESPSSKRPEGHPGPQSNPPAEGTTFPRPGTPVKD